jgi:hypothetical protein
MFTLDVIPIDLIKEIEDDERLPEVYGEYLRKSREVV